MRFEFLNAAKSSRILWLIQIILFFLFTIHGGIYGERKQRDFSVRHLLHLNLPNWNGE